MLSKKITNVIALEIAVAIWIGICAGAYYVTNAMEFYILACAVGMVMGGIQSLSRATYSKLIPSNIPDTVSYFSFYDVAEKIGIVIGMLLYGFIDQITGSMRNSVLFLVIFFVSGVVLLLRVPKAK